MIGGAQHRGSDGDDGLHGAAACFEAVKEHAQIGILDADRGPGGLDEGGFEPGGAFADARGAPLACALVAARAHSCPRHQAVVTGETLHIHAHLAGHDLGGGIADAGDRDEQLHVFPKGLQVLT